MNFLMELKSEKAEVLLLFFLNTFYLFLFLRHASVLPPYMNMHLVYLMSRKSPRSRVISDVLTYLTTVAARIKLSKVVFTAYF